MTPTPETGPTPSARPPSKDRRGAPLEAYVALAETGASGLWRAAAALGLLLALCILATGAALGAAAILAAALDPAGFDWFGVAAAAERTDIRLIAALTGIAAAWPGLGLALSALHGRKLSSVFGPAGRLRGWAFLLGAATAAAAAAAALGLAVATGAAAVEIRAVSPAFWALGALIALLIFFQATAEELVFRGYLLQELARVAGPRAWPVWAAAPALLFGALHYGPGDAGAAYAIGAAFFGLAAAGIVARTGGLSVAAGFHVMTNWIALIAFDPAVGLGGIGPLRLDIAPGATVAVIALDLAALCGAAALLAWAAPPERAP